MILEAETAAIQSTGSVSVSTARVKCRVFVDFDGTIAPVDTTDLLLERFAAPAWRDIEEEWKAGRIGSRECMVRQIDLVRATPAEMDAFIGAVEIDRGFAGFRRSVPAARSCARRGVRRARSHHQHGAGSQRHRRSLFRQSPAVARRRSLAPDVSACASSDCAALAGNCKCSFAEGRPQRAATSWSAMAAPTSVSRSAPTWCWPRTRCSSTAARPICRTSRSRISTKQPQLLAGWLEERGAAVAEPAARAVEE